MMQRDESKSDPFALLGLARRYAIDPAALQRAWLKGSAMLHPDRPGAPEDAAQRLAVLNEARDTLRDPEKRATALLHLLGGSAKEEDKTLPDGFLMEMLELRQQIEEELASEGDAARARWDEWGRQRRAEYVAKVGAMFEQVEEMVEPPADFLRAIRRELNAWRYIERLIEQLDPAYDPSRADFRGS